MKARQVLYTVLAVVTVVTLFTLGLNRLIRYSQVEHRKEVAFLESRTWRVESVKYSYSIGFVGTYEVDFIIVPIKGTEWRWLNFQCSNDYYLPDMWKPFIGDHRKKFKVKVDQEKGCHPANSDTIDGILPVLVM